MSLRAKEPARQECGLRPPPLTDFPPCANPSSWGLLVSADDCPQYPGNSRETYSAPKDGRNDSLS